MKKIRLALLGLFASAVLLFSLSPVIHAAASDVFDNACSNSKNNPAVCGGSKTGLLTYISNVIQVLFIAAGVVAVIMIIVGGIRYITSNGEQGHVKQAKDTILYSVIGLVIAILAYAIVRFVTGNI